MYSPIYWVNDWLGLAARPRAGDWLSDEVWAWQRAGVGYVVSLLTPAEVDELGLGAEPELVRKAGLTFTALPVPDRGVPDAPDRFWSLVATHAAAIAARNRVLVHCRQGIGRSSLFAAALLVRWPEPDRAMDVSEAWERVQAARGRPVPDTPDQRAWLAGQAGPDRDK